MRFHIGNFSVYILCRNMEDDYARALLVCMARVISLILLGLLKSCIEWGMNGRFLGAWGLILMLSGTRQKS